MATDGQTAARWWPEYSAVMAIRQDSDGCWWPQSHQRQSRSCAGKTSPVLTMENGWLGTSTVYHFTGRGGRDGTWRVQDGTWQLGKYEVAACWWHRDSCDLEGVLQPLVPCGLARGAAIDQTQRGRLARGRGGCQWLENMALSGPKVLGQHTFLGGTKHTKPWWYYRNSKFLPIVWQVWN